MTHVQPFHTYHEYLQGMNLAQTMRIKAKRYNLSEHDENELRLLEDRLNISTPIYNTFFNKTTSIGYS
jgi:hypothetical protein